MVEDPDWMVNVTFSAARYSLRASNSWSARMAAGLSSPWAHRRKIDLADLIEVPMAGTASCGVRRAEVMEAFRAQGSSPRQFTVTTFSVGLRSIFGMRGRFVIALPVSVLELHSNLFALKRLPIDRPESQLVIAIVTLKNRTLSP